MAKNKRQKVYPRLVPSTNIEVQRMPSADSHFLIVGDYYRTCTGRLQEVLYRVIETEYESDYTVTAQRVVLMPRAAGDLAAYVTGSVEVFARCECEPAVLPLDARYASPSKNVRGTHIVNVHDEATQERVLLERLRAHNKPVRPRTFACHECFNCVVLYEHKVCPKGKTAQQKSSVRLVKNTRF